MELVDIQEHMLNRLDSIDKNVDDLCVRTALLESSLRTHLEKLDKKKDRNLQKRDVIISALGLIFAVYIGIKEIFS